MKLELRSTCISLRIMLAICSSVCNCSESFGCYTHNNWLECLKMSNKLVPKNYQKTFHISAHRGGQRNGCYSGFGGGGWEAGKRLNKSVCQNRAKAILWWQYDATGPCAHWPASISPLLSDQSFRPLHAKARCRQRRPRHSQTHIQTDSMFVTTHWKCPKLQQ